MEEKNRQIEELNKEIEEYQNTIKSLTEELERRPNATER